MAKQTPEEMFRRFLAEAVKAVKDGTCHGASYGCQHVEFDGLLLDINVYVQKPSSATVD